MGANQFNVQGVLVSIGQMMLNGPKIVSERDSLAKSIKSIENCYSNQNNSAGVGQGRHIESQIRTDKPIGSSQSRGWMGHRRAQESGG